MPIHQWSRVDANLFHHFYQAWTMTICNSLNAGLLPKGFSALVEQHAAGLVPGGAVVTADPPRLPDMPAYLDPDSYVRVPLEATYQSAWATCPEDMREFVERAASPSPSGFQPVVSLAARSPCRWRPSGAGCDRR